MSWIVDDSDFVGVWQVWDPNDPEAGSRLFKNKNEAEAYAKEKNLEEGYENE